MLNWEDDPSCSALHDVLIYEVVVLRGDKQVHYVRVPYQQHTLSEQPNKPTIPALTCSLKMF